MNIQQLEYLLAVDTYKHFGKAAQACSITQPTLSVMVHKIEDELETRIFDRTTHPIRTTDAGKEIIAEVRKVLDAVHALKNKALELNGTVAGTLRLGIIPTVASYLVPEEIYTFVKVNEKIKIIAAEMTTENIIRSLQQGSLDAGIIAMPHSQAEHFFEEILFREELLLYASDTELLQEEKSYIAPDALSKDNLWLLEEGNCLKDQAEKICQVKHNDKIPQNLEYHAGNIHALIEMVDRLGGLTILPETAVTQLSDSQKKKLRHFRSPAPCRKISLIYYKPTYKQKIIDTLATYIQSSLESKLNYSENPENFTEIEAG